MARMLNFTLTVDITQPRLIADCKTPFLNATNLKSMDYHLQGTMLECHQNFLPTLKTSKNSRTSCSQSGKNCLRSQLMKPC